MWLKFAVVGCVEQVHRETQHYDAGNTENVALMKQTRPTNWEQINNPVFNSLEFDGIKNEAGRNSFFLSAKKWIVRTGAKVLK